MQREDAFYHKIILMTGLDDSFDDWLNHFLETENQLSNIVLELASCGADINKTISVLNSFCANQAIDQAYVCNRVRLFYKNAYSSNKMSKEEIVSSMYRLACNIGAPGDVDFDEYLWGDMYYLSDYFTLAKDGIISWDNFDIAFFSYLDNGTSEGSNQIWNHKKPKSQSRLTVNKKEVKLSPAKIAAVVLIGLALALFSFFAIITILDGFAMKANSPYLCRSYTPYREFLVIGVFIVLFILMLIFNIRIKRKWISALVNAVVIIALCNPFTLIFCLSGIPTMVNSYTIESEADFNQCAEDMGVDFSNFPKYKEFDKHSVQFVGKVNTGFFFYQSITAIVKYESLELCEADYNTYIDSHQFLTEPVIDHNGYYLIAAPEFNYEGIFFKVVIAEENYFPKQIYMIGIDRENSTLYYLYLNDHDLDYIANPDAQDLESEMEMHISEHYNLGT